MTDVHQALYRFWSSFGLPAYLSGHVPDGASLPYITFEIGDGEPFSRTFLTAIVWAKDNATRAGALDRIAESIPPDGVSIPISSGMLTLYRNGGGFMSYYDDPEDKTILGGRVSYQVNFYHL